MQKLEMRAWVESSLPHPESIVTATNVPNQSKRMPDITLHAMSAANVSNCQ